MNVLVKDYGFVKMKLTDVIPGIGGSRRFENIREDMKRHTDFIQKIPRMVTKVERSGTEVVPISDRPKRSYGMNVSYFKRKAIAYGLLNRSMRFLAFYTISFPMGMNDDIAYGIFNSTLTQLRKKHGLRSYLWCMERQKNGTVHFHMLTNDYMKVLDVNRIVAISIDYQVNNGKCTWGNSSLERYNGVDVKAITKSGMTTQYMSRSEIVKRVIRYLSKYMSKDLRSETHRVWHCSRLVSALFIQVSVSEWDMKAIMYESGKEIVDAKRIESNFYDIIIYNMIDSRYWQDTVVRANNMVYQYFDDNDLW